MELSITISANAGVCICAGNTAIWVDALHNRKVPGFSSVTPALFDEMLVGEKFPAPNAICVTHDHPDHFSPEMVNNALKHYQTAELILPWATDADSWHIGNMKITCCKLPHDGERFADCPHYGFLLTVSGKNILIPGDCRLCDPELVAFIGSRAIDVALLNFPWYTLHRARAFVAEHLHPRNTILYHLPFARDDRNGYRAVAEKAVHGETSAFLLSEPLQQLKLDI